MDRYILKASIKDVKAKIEVAEKEAEKKVNVDKKVEADKASDREDSTCSPMSSIGTPTSVDLGIPLTCEKHGFKGCYVCGIYLDLL